MQDWIREHAAPWMPASVSTGTVLAVNFSNIKEGVQIAMLLIGCVATGLTIYWNWRIQRAKSRAADMDVLEHEWRLCDDCRKGRTPKTCLIPVKNRPADCRLNGK